MPEDRLAALAPHGEGLPRVNVVATLPGGPPRPLLHFNGHYDVVPAGDGWSVDPYGAEIREGRIYGRGVSDMKGGIAAQVYAVEALRRAGFRLRGTVEQGFVPDEESTGNRNAGMGFLVEQGYIHPQRTDYVVITEPLEVDNICLGHRGTIQGAFETIGRQAHGAMPERGVNAIEKMALAIAAIERELKPQLREPPQRPARDPGERLRIQHHDRHDQRRHQHQHRGRPLPRQLRSAAGGGRDGGRGAGRAAGDLRPAGGGGPGLPLSLRGALRHRPGLGRRGHPRGGRLRRRGARGAGPGAGDRLQPRHRRPALRGSTTPGCASASSTGRARSARPTWSTSRWRWPTCAPPPR